MKRRVAHLFTELRLVLRGWRALRAVEFGKYRVSPGRAEELIEARLWRGILAAVKAGQRLDPNRP